MKTLEEIRGIMSDIQACIENDSFKYPSDLKKLWNDLSDVVTKLEQQHTSIQSLIDRVEKEKYEKEDNIYMQGYNAVIDKIIYILQSTPVIKAKALRKKGTDQWYYFNRLTNIYDEIDRPIIVTELMINQFNVLTPPSDAELVPIEILLP